MNPAEKGPLTLRLQFPANYDVPAHWHSMTERVTVLSGALHVGMGDAIDRKASQRLDPGGFVLLPARMHHFAWTTTPHSARRSAAASVQRPSRPAVIRAPCRGTRPS